MPEDYAAELDGAAIEIEHRDAILNIRLARPEKRNALDEAALLALPRLFDAVAVDYDVRVIVLAGAGPSFCAGVDRSNVPGSRAADTSDDDPDDDSNRPPTEREQRYIAQMGLRAITAIRRCEVPTIGRIQGHAIGGGALLAAACDFRILGAGAVFRIPEVELGIPLSWGGTPLLIHEIGAPRAREMILLGREVGAAEAVSFGLGHTVVPEEELDACVADWAAALAAAPESAIHMTKTQFRAYEALARLGDVTESDGDLLGAAFRSAAAQARFRR